MSNLVNSCVFHNNSKLNLKYLNDCAFLYFCSSYITLVPCIVCSYIRVLINICINFYGIKIIKP